jgi:hypothetical protein
MNERKTIVWFLLIAFGISWLLFLLPIPFGPPGSQRRQMVSLVAWSAAMWGPGLAAIVATRFVSGQSLGTLNLRRLGPKRPYLWAWLLPIVLAIVTGLFTFLTNVDIVIGGTVTSIIGWIGMALFVGWLVLSRRLPVALET